MSNTFAQFLDWFDFKKPSIWIFQHLQPMAGHSSNSCLPSFSVDNNCIAAGTRVMISKAVQLYCCTAYEKVLVPIAVSIMENVERLLGSHLFSY